MNDFLHKLLIGFFIRVSIGASPLDTSFANETCLNQSCYNPEIKKSKITSVVSLTLLYISSVIPAEAGIQNALKILDSGSRFACPE
jgi:hypothetical protein